VLIGYISSITWLPDLAVRQGTMTPSEGSDCIEDAEQEEGDSFMQEFKLHKKCYYEEKFKITVSSC